MNPAVRLGEPSFPVSAPAQVSISSPAHLQASPPVQPFTFSFARGPGAAPRSSPTQPWSPSRPSAPSSSRPSRSSSSNSPSGSRPAALTSCRPSPPVSAAEFLSVLLAHDFNLPEVAEWLTPEQLLEFTTDPDIREKLQSILDLNTICISLRQARARHVALAAMQSLVEDAADPLEKRRAATSLLRATTPPRSPSRSDQQSDDQPSEDSAPPAPPPRFTPSPNLTVKDIIGNLHCSLHAKNYPHEDAGLATIAAFCDDDATLNDEPLPTDSPDECVEALADSALTPYVGLCHDLYSEGRVPEDYGDEMTWTAVFSDAGGKTRSQITVHLRRRPDSRHPNCWLITNMTTGPYTNTS